MSVGAVALKAALTPKVTQEQLAELLGVKQQTISSWITGRTAPSAEHMAKMQDELKIEMRDWAKPAETDEADPSEPAQAPTGTEGA